MRILTHAAAEIGSRSMAVEPISPRFLPGISAHRELARANCFNRLSNEFD
jgi:hypothetical protein